MKTKICGFLNPRRQYRSDAMEFASRDEAKLWILDNQLGRRNLTDAMRIELALSKAELLRLRHKSQSRSMCVKPWQMNPVLAKGQ